MDIKEFLSSINLEHYNTIFVEEGYDDVEFLMTLDDKDFGEACISMQIKKGHQMKIKNSLVDLRLKKAALNETNDEFHHFNVGGEASSTKPVNVDKLVVDMLIPNPGTSKQLLYFNAVFDEIYKTAFHLMPVKNFREYIRGQQIFRWRAEENLQKVRTDLDLMASGETDNGRIINVHKYVHTSNICSPGDVSKLEETVKFVRTYIRKSHDIVMENKVNRTTLYTKNTLTFKYNYKVSELEHYARHVDVHEGYIAELEAIVITLQDRLRALRRKFTMSSIEDEEEKAKKSNKRRNDKRNANRKIENNVAKCN